jgi:hypothetical protein
VETTAATDSVAAAASASVAAAAAAASDKLEAGSAFPVEDVERRQADVEDFFLTKGEFVTRFDGPHGQICGGAGRLCDCAARQRQKSSGPQDWYGFAPKVAAFTQTSFRSPMAGAFHLVWAASISCAVITCRGLLVSLPTGRPFY